MSNTKVTSKLAWCMALTLAAVANGQQTSTEPAKKPGDLDVIRKVSAFIGTPVMNHTNTKTAVIRDLAISREGKVLYAVLGWGGLVGVAESYTAVPYELLGVRHDDGKWAINLDLSSDDLKLAPPIKSENYRELEDPQWIAQLDQFVRTRGESARHPERSANNGKQERRERNVERVLMAAKIRGTILKNSQNQDMGKIEDLLLDKRGQVAFAIIGRGGVLGVGENFIPVPWSILGLAENRQTAAVTVSIDATKARLEKAPLVKGDNYATLLAPGFAEQVREFFGAPSRDDSTNGSPDRGRQ